MVMVVDMIVSDDIYTFIALLGGLCVLVVGGIWAVLNQELKD